MPFFKKKRSGGKMSTSKMKKTGGKEGKTSLGPMHHLLGNPSPSQGKGVTKKH